MVPTAPHPRAATITPLTQISKKTSTLPTFPCPFLLGLSEPTCQPDSQQL